MLPFSINNYLFQVWWLDCPEPCARSCSGNSAPFFYNGGMYPESQVGSMYPNMLIQATYDAMASVNLSHEAVMLSRSAWAGAQRYGGAVWRQVAFIDIPLFLKHLFTVATFLRRLIRWLSKSERDSTSPCLVFTTGLQILAVITAAT